MHMADALISPQVGGVMAAAAAAVAAYSVRKIQNDMDEKKIPLMGVMGAFVFASQMINFAIPGTGSSGHLGGGMLLAILLGPYAGFLTMASVLLIQALFFGDGGLLAYGCNLFNLGFYTCFVAYPFLFRWIAKKGLTSKRIVAASMLSAVLGLQLGAFSVVFETVLSGRTELPFGAFVLVMQPIHFAIGIVEGLVTAAIVSFVWKARPEILENAAEGKAFSAGSVKKVAATLAVSAVILGGVFSWYASEKPDGLEWSMKKITGKTEFKTSDKLHEVAAGLQKETAIMPEYGFKNRKSATKARSKAGTSASGVVGGAMTLGLAIGAGGIVGFVKRKRRVQASQ